MYCGVIKATAEMRKRKTADIAYACRDKAACERRQKERFEERKK